ncbi:gTP-binding protein TypA/BipA [Firmicutes bacterium CAG:460]|uniref:translational GTPase TypA n=1 Tax=Candidatus Onthocola sp. TaxID=3085646 RepID=UPI00033F677F|nr:translational GTPase TypA [Bacillota bacterium]CDE50586.1 gTP-binding protein TypA/BipA [Firmicutes bacterium CAG:460]
MDKIINIAVVAHVDAGKSTLVDGLLRQSGVFRANEELVDCVMDSGDLEKERGITITAKNCAIKYKDYKINIVDTPGHADFSSEIERVIKTVDTVILLVDSAEGPMPQTRFVLKEALQNNLKPILFINKIDKKDERAEEVVDMTFNLFMELGATDEQLDFPILYGSARSGYAIYNMSDEGKDLTPLLETIVNNTKVFEGNEADPLQLQVCQLAYDDYIGRLGIGRINKGKIKSGETVSLATNDGKVESFRVTKLFVNEGIKRVEVPVAYFGDIVTVAGCSDVSIGDTICEKDKINPLPKIVIEEPTLSMNFLVNNSPFAGQSGKFLTSRHLKERLEKELETNVGLKVEQLEGADGFKVSGRGELHLSILLENMRREGYELSVSKPEVIFKEVDGEKCEPYEKVIVNVPNEYSGTVINSLNERKGIMQSVTPGEVGYTKCEYLVPTRGLIGYRGSFITETKGEGIMVRSFDSYGPYAGAISGRKNGVLVSMVNGTTFGYSLFNLSSRGTMIVDPSTDVYIGMIVGIANKEGDLDVNPCKNKELTNTRSAHADEAIVLNKAKKFTLEEALEFIEDDEYIEITPTEIRLRKKYLDPKERYRRAR